MVYPTNLVSPVIQPARRLSGRGATPASALTVVAFGDSTTAPRDGLIVYADHLAVRLVQ